MNGQPPWLPNQILELKRLYDLDMTYAKMGQALGRTKNSIAGALATHYPQRRPRRLDGPRGRIAGGDDDRQVRLLAAASRVTGKDQGHGPG